MNELIHICRTVANSEIAIHRLNKKVINMAKCCRLTNTRVSCLAVAGLLTMAVIAMQDKEIKALKAQVANLTKTKTHSTTEGQTEQKGA
jgi:hypothetical protein